MKKTALILALAIAVSVQVGYAGETLRLATTTSTYETGLLDHILPPFEREYKVTVHIISVGTGKALKLGENGDVDVILVHSREAEDRFVDEGYGITRRDVMYNDFVLLGPAADPAKINGLEDVKKALRRIRDSGCLFTSRGDDSGTDKKEKHLWSKAGVLLRGRWYLETGQGMSATLRIADEKGAYLLADRASFLFSKKDINLIKLVENDSDLLNPYGAIAINPERHPHSNYRLSMALIGWLTSAECAELINSYNIDGRRLFHAYTRGDTN